MVGVEVEIHNRIYHMECTDSERDHLLELARSLNKRLHHLKQRFPPMEERRLMVMLAMLLLDELSLLEQDKASLEEALTQQETRYASLECDQRYNQEQRQNFIITQLNKAAEILEILGEQMQSKNT